MATTTATKPRKRNDAYTGILAVSFLAMVGGCVLLYFDLEQYKDGDKLKKAPDPIKIDVPGAQLKVVPGSGTPPPKKEPEAPPMDPMMPPPGGARNDPMRDSTPVLLPPLDANEVSRPGDPVVVPPVVQPINAVEPTRGREPVATIPDSKLGAPPAPIVVPGAPMQKRENSNEKTGMPPEKRTVAPVTEPSLMDEPPVPPKRFQPPM